MNVDEGTAKSSANPIFLTGSPFGTVIGTDGPCVAYQDLPTNKLSAGTITVSGTTSPLTLIPSGTSPAVSYHLDTPSNLFAPGASITIHATGAEFPMFSASVQAPPVLAAFSAATTVSRAAGMTITWTAGTAPVVSVSMLGASASHLTMLLCRTSDSGSFTLSPSNLALVPASALSNGTAALGVARVAQTVVTMPGATATVGALSQITKRLTVTP